METWRDVPGYEGRYQVDALGRIQSLKGRQKILRHGWGRCGYASVVLSVDAVKRNFLVHRLVLLAFVGAPPEGQEVRHRNGDRADNRLTNLHYGTHAENQQDMVAHGRSLQGEKHHKAKLTEGEVMRIRVDPRGCHRMARAFGVSSTTILSIRSRRTWRHLPAGGAVFPLS